MGVQASNTLNAGVSIIALPIDMISDEEYSAITLRALENQWPIKVYDNGNYPTRTLSFWPVPQDNNYVEIWLWQPLATYETLDEELDLPPGYERYLKYKLAVEIAAEFGKEVQPEVKQALQEAENNIKRLNQRVPTTIPSYSATTLQPRDRGASLYDMIGTGAMPYRR